jgi:hypothetical protein
MNKEQQELLDEAYKNFEKQCIPGTGKKMSKEEFIEFIKTNNEFSKIWGLKIKERELSLEEREKIAITKYPQLNETPHVALINSRPFSNEFGDSLNIPTKLITITYNNKKIESYE